jgi:hypothetical protein
MAHVTLELLKALNTTLYEQRWTCDDLARLVTPASGVISSFDSIRQELAGINRRDLGDTPPAFTAIGYHR